MTAPTNLTGVPETMLWTLHNRASEALRSRPVLVDRHALGIYQQIDYDFERSFGPADGVHAVRSMLFDEQVRPWMQQHPTGPVVELACGLETQFQRLDNGRVRWYCVDVPEALAVRDRYLPADPRCAHIAKSALDLTWMDAVPDDGPVFITAQGLLMYFKPEEVKRLFIAIADRFPGGVFMFDTIPVWFAKKTVAGFKKTPHYQTPPMPWGVAPKDIDATLRGWSDRVASVKHFSYGPKRGAARWVMGFFSRMPWLRDMTPTVTTVRFAP